jgi:hypothetical protein
MALAPPFVNHCWHPSQTTHVLKGVIDKKQSFLVMKIYTSLMAP